MGGIREESRGHRAPLLVPAPFRRERRLHETQPSQHEEWPSQHEAAIRAYLGTPSMQRSTPNEKRTILEARADIRLVFSGFRWSSWRTGKEGLRDFS
jgi:hypothetical protein